MGPSGGGHLRVHAPKAAAVGLLVAAALILAGHLPPYRSPIYEGVSWLAALSLLWAVVHAVAAFRLVARNGVPAWTWVPAVTSSFAATWGLRNAVAGGVALGTLHALAVLALLGVAATAWLRGSASGADDVETQR